MKRLAKTASISAIAAAMLGLSGQAYSKDVAVHLFEWKWTEIANECETFLGPKGYNAVQISPPNEHVDAPNDPNNSAWWVRYQPVSFVNLTSRSGNEAELQDMIQRCNAVGVEVIADAVINHMANYPAGFGVGSGGSVWNSNNADYPDMDGWGNDFHTCYSKIDWNDRESTWGCQLDGMPDVRTENPATQDKLAAYLNKLTGMGVAGFRIDAAKSIRPSELNTILEKAGNPWAFLEVIDNGDAVGLDDYDWMYPLLTEFGYAVKMQELFVDGQLKWLETFGDSWMSIGSDKAWVFVTNHDRERNHGGGNTIHYDDPNGAQNLATVFMLAHPFGTPKVHSSFAFSNGDQGRPGSSVDCDSDEWVCQHRWGNIANMVGFRNEAGDAPVANWWDNNNNQIAFGRGDRGFVVINNEGGTLNQTLQTGLKPGNYCDVMSNLDECEGDIVTVDDNGFATFVVAGYSAAAIHVGFQPDVKDKPVAVITGAPARVDVGTSVLLDASSSTDADGYVVGYQWSTGETTAAITKVLDTEGLQTFSVTVEDNDGLFGTAEVNIQVGDAPAECRFGSLHFRGTANGWAATEMTCVEENVWEAEVTFDGQADQRFKLDVNGDWSENYGDTGADGTLEQTGTDIFTDVVGKYAVRVNDSTMTYELKLIEGVDEKPVAVVTPSSVTVDLGDTVTFSATDSTDDKGIDGYDWSTGDSDATIQVTFNQVGPQQVTVTVIDTAGQTDTAVANVTVVDPGEFVSNLDALNFRGTANGWNASAMTLIADNTWQIQVSFDGQAEQRFKFDVLGDWSNNFGDDGADGSLEQTGADIYTDVSGEYLVTVNDDTMTYTIKPVACDDCGFNSNLDSLYFRGTPNGWTTTAMTLVADNTWFVEVAFDGQADQRFKFDVHGDWSYNFGDDGADGSLEQTGADIYTNANETLGVTVNDADMTYTFTTP
ncbi:alpha-amlyase [Corallincola holothuriorum]|uniref:Alpha-amylase n=1 Tax=Corallincola holothuriorum TaxID=2282215 RepID=A0A368NLE5_9GAMM|nr:alpha amylase C-terminal domain-containing protein [Corallincola holothuriorum]RCU50940.1 alpha-amlyase [Corallincola holothuriorum]